VALILSGSTAFKSAIEGNEQTRRVFESGVHDGADVGIGLDGTIITSAALPDPEQARKMNCKERKYPPSALVRGICEGKNAEYFLCKVGKRGEDDHIVVQYGLPQ
jgi:hypothetical protein